MCPVFLRFRTGESGQSLPSSMTPLPWLVPGSVQCSVQFMASIQLPPLLLFSGASAAFGGYALPKFAQLSVTSYYSASSASHYWVSLLTRHVEEAHTSQAAQQGKLQ
ncbi:hypothetical protein CRG98_036706 [Punica granatum]|uniref:Uncharacterized protein n=1 Tax=Punica granatum TaxID=22663 RepID=A0A2I0IG15_PUNGR|nr:hypothetical protein CRG98_036706 [Punica granatum]